MGNIIMNQFTIQIKLHLYQICHETHLEKSKDNYFSTFTCQPSILENMAYFDQLSFLSSNFCACLIT